MNNVDPMILNDFPAELKPKIQMLNTWFNARKPGVLFEAKVGKLELMVTFIDFEHELDNRLAARQLYPSLLEYMNSEKFDPEVEVNSEQIKSLYIQICS